MSPVFGSLMFQAISRSMAATTRASTGTERLRLKAKSVVWVPANGESGTVPGRTVTPPWDR